MTPLFHSVLLPVFEQSCSDVVKLFDVAPGYAQHVGEAGQLEPLLFDQEAQIAACRGVLQGALRALEVVHLLPRYRIAYDHWLEHERDLA